MAARAGMRISGRITIDSERNRANALAPAAALWLGIALAPLGAHAQPACTLAQITSGSGGFAGSPVISADGRWVAFRSDRNPAGQNADGGTEAFLYDRATQTFTQVTNTLGASHSLGQIAISGDGSYLAFGSSANFVGANADANGEMFLWERATSTFTQVTLTTGGQPAVFANDLPHLSADGQRLIFASDRNLTGANADGTDEVFLYQRLTSTLTQISDRSPADITSDEGNISGDGRWIGFTDGQGQLRLHDVAQGQSAAIVPVGFGIQNEPSLDHSGGRVVFFSNVTPGAQPLNIPELFLHDRATGKTARLTHHQTPQDVNTAGMSADGNRVGFFSTLNLAGANADGGHELFLYDVPSAMFRQLTDADLPLSLTAVPRLDLTGDRIVFDAAADLTGQNPTGAFQVFLAACQPPPPLALRAGRFQVRASWRTAQGSGVGTPVALTPESGYLWFFQPDNVELVGKVLDGCGLPPGRLLFFGAGLTNVEVRLAVTDTKTQALRTYFNPLGRNFKPIQDTGAFATCPVVADEAGAAAAGTSPETVADLPDEANSPLLLHNGRFRVDVSWRTAQGATGTATGVPITSASGYFWFFKAENLELLLKVHNACSGFNRYWVFITGLTNVEVEVTVTDTLKGKSRTYKNPLNRPFPPIFDTQAFATCP